MVTLEFEDISECAGIAHNATWEDLNFEYKTESKALEIATEDFSFVKRMLNEYRLEHPVIITFKGIKYDKDYEVLTTAVQEVSNLMPLAPIFL